MIEPITPKSLKKDIPEEVIAIFNELIALNYSKGSSVVVQNDVLEKITKVMYISRNDVFNKHYLDIEDLYTEWDVTYNKPAYNETYDAFFMFKAKK